MTLDESQSDNATGDLEGFDPDEATQVRNFPLSDDPAQNLELETELDNALEPTQIYDSSLTDPGLNPTGQTMVPASRGKPPRPASRPLTRCCATAKRTHELLPTYEQPYDPALAAPPRRLFTRKYFVRVLILLLVALAAAITARIFVVETFVITSNSMSPALVDDHRILVNKLSYTFSDVGRGDIVVFKRPPTDLTISDQDLIKRVIALENEVVSFANGKVYINGNLLVEPYVPDGVGTFVHSQGQFFDKCIDQTTHTECQVAPGHVFVMGDNRGASHDSRIIGPVSEDLIVGRTVMRIWPLGDFLFY